MLHTAPAFAASSAEHVHVGQKIANYFRKFGIPDMLVLGMISALPVVELRGAVPVGIWMGLPISTVLAACILGNMAPIVPLLFLLKSDKIKYVMCNTCICISVCVCIIHIYIPLQQISHGTNLVPSREEIS